MNAQNDYFTSTTKSILNLLRSSQKTILTDPNISLVKLRQSLELLVEYLCVRNNLEENLTLYDSIEKLKNLKIINLNQEQCFHSIRVLGNKAVHERYYNIEEAKKNLREFTKIFDKILSVEHSSEYADKEDSKIEIKNEYQFVSDLLVKMLEINQVVPIDINNNKDRSIINCFTIPTTISDKDKFNVRVNLYIDRVELISTPLKQNVAPYEKLFYINLVNYFNLNFPHLTYYFEDDNIRVKSVKSYYSFHNIESLVFDIFHSITGLIFSMREFLTETISDREGNL